ncbi:hypothetical protein PsYK624_086960 [Phanerochaete sordida]|uniref:Uncharacterized protein n=1 Tax=Phanerochaete sordida TaxID=48140 RepID=A0A9P3GCU2_9APHY|nr:hypothetical protein PsYK624_086960 [Phanerochaete sordida]
MTRTVVNNGGGTLLVTVSQLYARLYDEGRYSITITPNEPRGHMLTPPPISFGATAGSTLKPVWHSPEREIASEPGTYTLKLKVYRHLPGQKEELVGEAKIHIHELSPEQPTDLDLVSPVDARDIGALTLYLRPCVPLVRGGIDLASFRQIQGKSALVSSLVTVSQDLQSLDKTVGERYAVVGIASAYALAILQYLERDYPASQDTIPTPTHSPIWDLALQIELQLHHFATRYWPEASRNNQHAASLLASEFLPIITQSLALIFGFVDRYKDQSYTAIDARSTSCGHAFRTHLFALLALGGRMRGISDAAPLASADAKPQAFLSGLARAYATHFAGDTAPSGPWIDYLDCFRGELAKLMGLALQKAIEETERRPGDANYRAAARRLMAMLARKTESPQAGGRARSVDAGEGRNSSKTLV